MWLNKLVVKRWITDILSQFAFPQIDHEFIVLVVVVVVFLSPLSFPKVSFVLSMQIIRTVLDECPFLFLSSN